MIAHPWLRRLAGWAAAGLILALAGVQTRASGRPPVDLAVSAAWIVGVTLAFHRLSRHETLWPWLTAASSASLAALAAISQQWTLAGVAGLLLALGAGLGLARRPGWVRLAADVGLVAIPAAAVAVLLDFPSRPMWGTWMLPLVVFGLPLASLGWEALGWGVRALGGEWAWGDVAAALVRQGYTAAGAGRALVAGSAILGVVAVGMSLAEPFVANLGLAGLVGGAAVAGRPRAVRRAGWLPAALYAYAALVLTLFVASLRYRFLNRFFPGVMPNQMGLDFYTIPRAFDYLLHGVSMYQRAAGAYQSHYGPHATDAYQLHPLFAIVPGSLLFALPPLVAYAAFVAFSVAALLGLCWLYGRLSANPVQQSLMAVFLLASWPLYGMLWMAQMQVFAVIAFGLIGAALLEALAGGQGWRGPLVVGFLAGLFSKPLVVLLLPALLVSRFTRKAGLIILAAYGAVSLVFVVVPFLNPGQVPLAELLAGRVSLQAFVESGNLYHWYHILTRSEWLATNWREVFSLPVILNVLLPGRVVVRLGQALMLALVGYLVWAMWGDRPREQSLRLLALAALLVNAAYFVTYPLILEYQYATLVVVPAGLLLLRTRTADPALRRFLTAGLIACAPLLLPSAYALVVPNPVPEVFWDYSTETLAQMTVFRASRVLPALALVGALILAIGRARQLAETARPALHE